MQNIESILFEPVGCLAEFPSGPFLEAASRLFDRKKQVSQSGSRAYWHLLNLVESGDRELDESERRILDESEIQAASEATVYEDVTPALGELKSMGVKLFIASSLSRAAVARFVERNSLSSFFAGVWSTDEGDGRKAAPLRAAISASAVAPGRILFMTDTLEGLKLAQSAGVQPILMMNDPDEARRLSMHGPSGGIVSLHELPDFVRLVAAQNAGKSGAHS